MEKNEGGTGSVRISYQAPGEKSNTARFVAWTAIDGSLIEALDRAAASLVHQLAEYGHKAWDVETR